MVLPSQIISVQSIYIKLMQSIYVKRVKNVKNRLSVVSVYTNRLSVIWIELIPEVTRVALFGMD